MKPYQPQFSMNLIDCYRLLGLNAGAELEQIKASYRRLARQYHPDVNPGNQEAKAQFMQLTEAYKFLLSVVKESQKTGDYFQEFAGEETRTKVIKVTDEQPPAQEISQLSAYEQQLKWNAYENLQQLLQQRKFARAIALIEGLAQRLPQDREVRQWQAIIYQQRGRQLVNEKQLDRARIYLKKALRTDPHNRALCDQVEEDFRQMEQML